MQKRTAFQIVHIVLQYFFRRYGKLGLKILLQKIARRVMMKKWIFRGMAGLLVVSALTLTASADLLGGLFQKGVKIVGVDFLVRVYGKEINHTINKLSHHTDAPTSATKVVPIISLGLGARSAVGAVQVTGPKNSVDQVVAVAQPEVGILGDQVRIRALIPVSSKNLTNIKKVEGVGISGIADLKL